MQAKEGFDIIVELQDVEVGSTCVEWECQHKGSFLRRWP